MRNYRIWKFTKDKIKKGIKSILLIVAEHEGSSPGKQGFKMVITEEGEQFGTIGGGTMELSLIEKSHEFLKNKDTEPTYIIQKHHKNAPEAEQSGLSCSGQQKVLIVPILPKYFEIFDYTISSYGTSDHGILEITPDGLALTVNEKVVGDYKFEFTNTQDWQYWETVGDPYTVYIFGGGHVGRAISRVLATLDFYVILHDNRDDLLMMQNNPFPHKKVYGKYSEIAQNVQSSEKSFVVVVTFGYDYDAEVLLQIMQKEVRFVGLMGSKSKIRRIFNYLIENGIDREETEKIVAPIGLNLNDETAEEIAISVAAQLIKVKNG